MSKTVLIVDDEPVQRRLLDAAVTRFGFRSMPADSGEQALEMIDEGRVGDLAVIVLDLVLPGVGGMDVLTGLAKRGIDVPVIVQTAQGSIETAVSAMRLGAFDFVVKPVSPDRLKTAIDKAVKVRTVEGSVGKARAARKTKVGFEQFASSDPGMARVARLGQKAASSDIPVLIEGESGVGKELFARAIQEASERSGKPFVTVNCGAIPENLVESILFGHEKGAFTGATEKHAGKFVEANGGTLFLDEIGDLPLNAQVKLLRAVQEGEVDPVGSRHTVKVDIRLISATHRDLMQQVREGRFREDLYYRLNVFPIALPPLRERLADIPQLARGFVTQLAEEAGSSAVNGLGIEALDLLCAYDWPGNIRQLQNAIFRALVLCEGDRLEVADFPQIRAQVEMASAMPRAYRHDAVPHSLSDHHDFQPLPPLDGRTVSLLDAGGDFRPLVEIEDQIIQLAIDHYDGQMSEVARRLGIGRSTLYRKLKDLGIDPDEKRNRDLD